MKKVKAIDMNGQRIVGAFFRHVDNYLSVIYAGGYESVFVERNSIIWLDKHAP